MWCSLSHSGLMLCRHRIDRSYRYESSDADNDRSTHNISPPNVVGGCSQGRIAVLPLRWYAPRGLTDHTSTGPLSHVATMGVRALIAIHDTTLGPAFGGCRMYPYASEQHAMTDVLRLSRARFELVWGFSCQVVVLGFAESSLFGAGKPFFIPSPAIRFAERAEGVKGPKR